VETEVLESTTGFMRVMAARVFSRGA